MDMLCISAELVFLSPFYLSNNWKTFSSLKSTEPKKASTGYFVSKYHPKAITLLPRTATIWLSCINVPMLNVETTSEWHKCHSLSYAQSQRAGYTAPDDATLTWHHRRMKVYWTQTEGSRCRRQAEWCFTLHFIDTLIQSDVHMTNQRSTPPLSIYLLRM